VDYVSVVCAGSQFNLQNRGFGYIKWQSLLNLYNQTYNRGEL